MPAFYEFFAGGGMARAGLGQEWDCLFANDFSEKKGEAYRANWGDADLVIDDIAQITTANLPASADLAWASFPCQDLSVAGKNEGLGEANSSKRTRSGTFWHFIDLMRSLKEERREPSVIVLENVAGAISSHEGKDLTAIASEFCVLGFRVGVLVIDAQLFVPQSRKRVFIIGIHDSVPVPGSLQAQAPDPLWHTKALVRAQQQMPQFVRNRWIWWSLPTPQIQALRFIDILEERPTGVTWHTQAETKKLLQLMSSVNLEKVHAAMSSGERVVGGVYRRMRPDGKGGKCQRAEVRFDDVAGCLRTPSGGSSRQIIMLVEGDQVRTRLLSPREGARLMGLPDDYILPTKYNDAYHLVGDGVVVPVVRHLAAHLFEPLLAHQAVKQETANTILENN